MRFDITLGSTKDGVLESIDCKVLSDTGAYGEHALTVFMVAGSKVLPLYNKVKSVRFYGDVVYTNHTSAGAFRGYGAIQGNFALESAIDMLCEKLGVDPIEFRDKNMIKKDETSPIFEIMGEGTAGTAMVMESCELEYCLHRGKEISGWDEIYPYKQISPTKRRAMGMAIAMQGSGIPYIDMGSATIKLNDDGFYNLLIGATDIGQGSDTVLAQIAAEKLGCTMAQMIVYSSDSDLTPFDTGAYASSTTYVSGNAVFKAATKMRGMLLDEAANVFKLPKEEINFDGVTFEAADKSISLKELSNRLYYNEDQKQLTATSSYVGTKSPPPFMTGYVDITIDTETGELEINNYTSIVDCGVPLNTMLARGQVEGGIVQGIGMAVYEEVIISNKGKMITNDFLSYLLKIKNQEHKKMVAYSKVSTRNEMKRKMKRYKKEGRECGLDLVFYDVDRLGKCRYMGAQVKAGNIHKSVGEHTSKNIITILQQVQQAFESTMYIPSEKKELELDRMFVISSKSITQPAREYIRKSLMGKVYSQHIEFWDAEAIVDFILSTQES